MNPFHRQTPEKLRLAFPNSQKKIDSLQGLEIQPFIFDLCTGLGELGLFLDAHAQNGDFKQKQHFEKIHMLGQSLFSCGYGSKGTPYWVMPLGPKIDQIRDLVEKGEDCISTLNTRRVDLAKKLASTPESYKCLVQKEQTLFEEHYTRYTRGLSGLQRVADAQERILWERERRLRHQSPFAMCALE